MEAKKPSISWRKLRFVPVGILMGLGYALASILFLWVGKGFDTPSTLSSIDKHIYVYLGEVLSGCLVLGGAGYWVGSALASVEEQRDQAREKADHDSLTGLLNHASIMARLSRLIADPRNTDKPFCVVMADIDFFKRINDEFGHPVGDEVLERLSAIFLKSLRESDQVGRYGGEEFMLILTRTEKAQAIKVLERLRQTVKQQTFHDKDDPQKTFHISITMGICSNEEFQDPSAQMMVTLADDRLLRGKKEGRDRVVGE